MSEIDWNDYGKRLLKAELIKRGISHEELAFLLKELNVHETKSSIDSKISRGTFSAAFLLQCLNAIECKSLEPTICEYNLIEETRAEYKRIKSSKKTKNGI